ncbi:Hypothetical predicted protein, partial [Marmota monax]
HNEKVTRQGGAEPCCKPGPSRPGGARGAARSPGDRSFHVWRGGQRSGAAYSCWHPRRRTRAPATAAPPAALGRCGSQPRRSSAGDARARLPPAQGEPPPSPRPRRCAPAAGSQNA